jgi:hypothetical protein
VAKAKRPVSINGVEFDALLDEERTLSADSPDYPVEDGFSVEDTIILKPQTLSMTLFVTDTPVTWKSRGHGGNGWTDSVIQRLEGLYFAKQPVTIITSSKTYRNMAIMSISIAKSADAGYARQIPISFKEIRKTSSKTATIPDSYPKSGATGTNAGTASTEISSTPAPGVSVAGLDTFDNVFNDSGGGLPSLSSLTGGSKSSMAFNLAKAAGLL